MSEARSPLAPVKIAEPHPISGLRLGTASAGIKYKNREDVTVMVAAPGSSVAGVFTQNACPGAPVDWSRQALDAQVKDDPKVIIVTAGNSNVFTGKAGRESVRSTARAAAAQFGGNADGVFIASTGVIGEPLPPEGIVATFADITLKEAGWRAAADAILTTDTYPKLASQMCSIHGAPITITGIAKGSGMIAPDMATMLAFVATDATITPDVLQSLLSEQVQSTFNAITVDSDTSTSDTLLLIATGQAAHAEITEANDSALIDFRRALQAVLLDLALQIVKDGEGASKFVTIEVSGAVSDASARRIALSVANSPLVKTAIAGEDANWGRIVMAVGKAGEPADRDRLTVRLGEHVLAEQGELASAYKESDGAAYMQRDHIEIGIDIGLGQGQFTAYTCDFTHGYISINADYRS